MFEIPNLEKEGFLFNKQLRAFSNHRQFGRKPNTAYLIEARLSDMMMHHYEFFTYYEIRNVLNDQLKIIINTAPFKIFQILLRDKDEDFGDEKHKSYQPYEVLNGSTLLSLLITRPQKII